MTRRQGEPPDGIWRATIGLSAAWAQRLLAILDRKQIKYPEQVRRWIVMEEWVTEHTADDAARPLYIGGPDGTYERVSFLP